MAEPKEKSPSSLSILKKMREDYGIKAIPNPTEAGTIKRIILDSPKLNYAFGGGFPIGRIVELFGPESGGKCYHIDTQVLTPFGYKKIGDIFTENDVVPSCTNKTVEKHIPLINRYGEIEYTTHFTCNGKRKTITLKTRSGNSVEVTENNPMLVLDISGVLIWKNASDMEVGDVLVSYKDKFQRYFGSETLVEEEAYLLGALIADGYFGEDTITFSNDDSSVLNIIRTFSSLIGAEGFNERKKETNNSFAYRFRFPNGGANSFYKKYDLYPGIAKDKKVPKVIISSTKETMASFIRGYMDSESSISLKKRIIEVCSASFDLLSTLKRMLLQFGIVSFLREKKVKHYEHNQYWVLSITGTEAIKYIQSIGSKSDKVKERYALIQEDYRKGSHDLFSVVETVPNFSIFTKNWYRSGDIKSSEAYASFITGSANNPEAKGIRYSQLEKMLRYAESSNFITPYIQHLLKMEYHFDEVTELTHNEPVPTFDFAMERTQSLIVNGLVGHNTTIASNIGGSFQRRKDKPEQNKILFVDMEHAFHAKHAETVGLNLSEEFLTLVQPLCGEEGFEIAEALARTGEYGLVIWDSIASTSSAGAMRDEYGKANVGATARVMASGLQKLNPYLSRFETSLILINQIRSKIGGFQTGFGPQENCVAPSTMVEVIAP